MRQLETLIGSDGFRDGLREYLRKHSFGNASWPDLIALLDGRTPEDLAAWSRAWVGERGRPVITTELKLSNGKIDRLAFTQRDPFPARGLTWNQRITVALGGRRTTLVPVQLNAKRVEVPAARGLPAEFVLPNGGGIAYGEFHLDRASLTWLMANLPSIEDELTRGSAWVTLWESMLTGDMTPDAFLTLAIQALRVERNELNISRVLSYARDAYWRYSTFGAHAFRAADRAGPAARPRRRGKASLKSSGLCAARHGADAAHHRVADPRVEAGGASTRTDLVRKRLRPARAGSRRAQRPRHARHPRSAVRAHEEPGSQGAVRVREAVAVCGCGAARAWFASLLDAANRRREPWVLEGLRYLHHPLRAAASEKHLETSLVLVREIQRTGDIFFPKRWMDATLSGHQSGTAAATVRKFVDGLPGISGRLRRAYPASADDLFRATRALMQVRIVVTVGTFDKEYDELTASSFSATALEEMPARTGASISRSKPMMIDSSTGDADARNRGALPDDTSARCCHHGTDPMVETARALPRPRSKERRSC